MGVDIHLYIAKLNKQTNIWEELELFHKNQEKVYAFQDRNHDIFDMLDENSSSYTLEMNEHVTGSVATDFLYAQDSLGFYKFREINLADLKLATKSSRRYKWFIKLIENYINFAEDSLSDAELHPSSYKIIYWYDH